MDAEDLNGTVTICNVCGAEMPTDQMEADVSDPEEVVTFGSPCLSCGDGTYSQHEDALSLKINQLTDHRDQREKIRAAGHAVHEVGVSEKLNVSDKAVPGKVKK